MPLAMLTKFPLFSLLAGLFLFSSGCSGFSAVLKDKRESDGLAHYMMGIFYERQNKLDEAVAEYYQVTGLDSQSAQPHLRLGMAYARKSELDKAIEELTQAKKLSPESVEPKLILALLYTAQNKSDKALEEYEEILDREASQDPENTAILKSLGTIYYYKKDFQKAIHTYTIITNLDKEDYESLFVLGSLLEETGRRKEAIQKLKQAIALKPDYADGLNTLGYLYAEDNTNLVEAQGLVQQALSYDPQNPAYIDSLGWVYFKRELFKEAIEQLEKAASQLEDPVIFDHLGDAFYKSGDNAKAVSAWKKSLELDPKQEKVKVEEKIGRAKR